MKRLFRRLMADFVGYHQHGPQMLHYLSILGFFAFPAFYLLRFTKADVPYDDLVMRLAAMVLCAGLFFRRYWPRAAQPWFYLYSYVTIIVGLPMNFVFTSLMNGGGPVASGNTVMAIFFVILLADWRNTIVMLGSGVGLAVLAYVGVADEPQVPADYVARIPLFTLVVVGGCFFKLAAERATAARVRHAYASLAGSIAHELRNPLGQLRHSLDRMRDALPAPTVKAQPRMLDAASVNALYSNLAQGEIAVRRGLQVISMTLDEVSARPLDASSFAWLSAGQACAKALDEYCYASAEERSHVSLSVRHDFVFRGDETAFVFVLFNLVKNALYYLPTHPAARVDITVDAPCIRVRDTGPGIAAQVMDRLFEAFATRGKTGGSGLGLAYCRRVMQAFGGGIRCESELGAFTEFTLTLPPVDAQAVQAHALEVTARARSRLAGLRILVVDDDEVLRASTCRKLAELDAIVDEAADGVRAFELLGTTRHDLIILDLNMPGIDGYALAQRVRAGQAPLNRDACIVAYTSEPAHLAQIKTQKAGIDGFISKPADRTVLLEALGAALAHPAGKSTMTAGLAGRRVLLADDNVHNRRAVVAYLRHAGVEVSQAGSGEEVLARVRDTTMPWDAIFLDINMPGMSGLDTAKAIRATAAPVRDVPLIALTAHSGDDIMAAAREAGMSAFLVKPVSAGVLYAKLREAVAIDGSPPQGGAGVVQAAPAVVSATELLDMERLASYRRIGMLEELMGDYVPEIARLVQRLADAVSRDAFNESLDIMHSLAGMSGEAGAAALHARVRGLYGPMLDEARWPSDPDWVGQIEALTEQTQRALRQVSAVPPSAA